MLCIYMIVGPLLCHAVGVDSAAPLATGGTVSDAPSATLNITGRPEHEGQVINRPERVVCW